MFIEAYSSIYILKNSTNKCTETENIHMYANYIEMRVFMDGNGSKMAKDGPGATKGITSKKKKDGPKMGD